MRIFKVKSNYMKKMQFFKGYLFVVFAFFALVVAGCKNKNEEEVEESQTTSSSTSSGTTVETNYGDDEDDDVNAQTWNDTISIVWNGSSAAVDKSVEGVTISNSNGYVSITSTVKHIAYKVSGEGTGQLRIESDHYKFKLIMAGLTLTNSTGPAINNQCHKSCYVVLTGANNLTDGSAYTSSTEDQKAAFFSEGQILVSGTGSLTAIGNYKHALCSDDYIRIYGGTLNLTAKVSDGIHTNDGVIINGGTITVAAANDGIQCDTSSIVISGGTINVSSGDKGILAYGNIEVSGGTINVKSNGKGIKTKGDLSVSAGEIVVVASSSYTVSYLPRRQGGPGGGQGGGQPGGGQGGGQPGGGQGGDQPGGGNSSSGPEGIESKGAMTITGGHVFAQAEDDAINSGGDMTISGGYVGAYSTGNDGLDANGNCYIKGGVVYAIGSSSPEVGIDANTEKQKQLYVTGGSLIAIGGLEQGASLSQACYQASWNSSTWYALNNNGNLVLAFKTPASGGTPLVVSTSSTPTLQSGVTASNGTAYFNGMALVGATISGGSNVSLTAYSSQSGSGPR